MAFSNVTPRDWFSFADNAYADPVSTIPQGWEVLEVPSELLDDPNTGYQANVFINRSTGEIVVGHRGSSFGLSKDTKRDWYDTNTDLVFDRLNSQYGNALALTQYIQANYPNAPVGHAGHSLGGWLSQMMALTYGQPAASYDSPGTLNQIVLMQQFLTANGFEGSCYAPSAFITAYESVKNSVNDSGEDIITPVNLFSNSSDQLFLESHTREYILDAFDPNTGQLKNTTKNNGILKKVNAVNKVRKDVVADIDTRLAIARDNVKRQINTLDEEIINYLMYRR